MQSLFMIFLIVHILSAMVGFGPMFQAGIIRRTAGTLAEVRHSLAILERTRKAPRHTIYVMAATGAGLVWTGNIPWEQAWLHVSIVLLIALWIVLFLIVPRYYQKLAVLAHKTDAGQETTGPIFQEFKVIENRLRQWEYLSLGVVAAIFLLMILRPF